ncbi:hypothetical protein GCM10010129_07870 [Streptomyces fumigatiscleroticus]|nr:hypothetical protein GCM10010129_07870 [Streptomyces fumigatiscleroticus]
MIPAFLPFYESICPRSAVHIALRASAAAVVEPEHLDDILEDIRGVLLRTVEEHSFRTLIGEFHTFRESQGLPMTTDGDQALRLFHRRLADTPDCARTRDTYPVLEQRLQTIVRNSLAAYAEVFLAFAADREVLRDTGLISSPAADERIVKLSIAGSDAHNDNRQVVGVQLSSGARLVFKPRALHADRFVNDLYAAADPHLTFSLRECLPVSVTCGSHGWQKFVEAAAMESPDQPARYFYRFGALCALFGAIGSCDLHEENVLADGEHPCVIDTETVVRPGVGAPDDTLPHLLANHLSLSVISTMLVPVVNPGSPIDVLLAGVGIAEEQSSTMKRPVVRDNGTDHIHVAFETMTYRHGSNVPRLGDRAVAATEYFDDVLAGYFDALAFVRGDDITKVLDSHPGMPVRCLLRSTMVYSRFINASTHPDYLKRPEEAERLFRLLGRVPGLLPEAVADHVRHEERTDLATGNVPYFMTRGDSTELATVRNRFPAAYETSPLDVARHGVALNAARGDLCHRLLLEESLSEMIGDDNPAGLSRSSLFGGSTLEAAGPGTWWPGIVAKLLAAGLSFAAPDGPQTGWLGGIGPGRDAPTIVPGTFIAFHDHGGIVTFLERAAWRDDHLRTAHASADRGLDVLLAEYGDLLMQRPESVFSGAASMLLTRPYAAASDWLERMWGRIGERSASGELGDDLATGPAGLLMVLLSRHARGERGDPGDETRLAWLHEQVLRQVNAPRAAAWWDVAHGELGLRWACSRSGSVLDDAALVTASAEWVQARLESEERSPFMGWCKGAAGLLLASAEIMTAAGRADWLTGGRLRALLDHATRLPADRPVDLSVCHGSSGVVQSLIAAARILDDASLLARAHEYQEHVLDTVRANGFFTGAAGRTSLLGYMLGWAGVGDTDLLLHTAGTDDVPGVRNPGVPVALAHGVFE